MAVERDRYAEEFAELALALHDETVEETVEKVLEFTLKAVGCDYAGVIFVRGKHDIETAAATDPLVAKLDAMQMEVGEGPDVSVLDDRLSVIVSDTWTERRWPRWAARVYDSGIRSLISVRMYTDDETIGTLNAYSRHAGRVRRRRPGGRATSWRGTRLWRSATRARSRTSGSRSTPASGSGRPRAS